MHHVAGHVQVAPGQLGHLGEAIPDRVGVAVQQLRSLGGRALGVEPRPQRADQQLALIGVLLQHRPENLVGEPNGEIGRRRDQGGDACLAIPDDCVLAGSRSVAREPGLIHRLWGVDDGLEGLADPDPSDRERGEVAHQAIDTLSPGQDDETSLAVGLGAPRRAHPEGSQRPLRGRRCVLVLHGPGVGRDDDEPAHLGQPQSVGDLGEVLACRAAPAEQRRERRLAQAPVPQQVLGLHVAVGGCELLTVDVHGAPQCRRGVEKRPAQAGVLTTQAEQSVPDVERGQAVGVQHHREWHLSLGALTSRATGRRQEAGLVDHHALHEPDDVGAYGVGQLLAGHDVDVVRLLLADDVGGCAGDVVDTFQ